MLHDPPERFRHRSHPVGDFGESGGELFTVPKNRGNRCPAFRPVCAGKRRNAQIYAGYTLKSLSHGITDGIREHEAGVRHGTAAVQENVNRRIRRFPETVLHEHSGIPDRHPVAQRRGKTPSYSRHGGQPSAASRFWPVTATLSCFCLSLGLFSSIRSARASPNPLGSSSEDNAPTAFAKESREAFEEATDSS